jgi:hypothetical protein
MDEAATGPRVIATIHEYGDLVDALRRWFLDGVGTSFDAVDEVAGLPARYCSKLLAAEPMKGFGRKTLGPVLGAGGLKLLLVVDEPALAKVRHRPPPPKPSTPFARSVGARAETLRQKHWRRKVSKADIMARSR